VSGGRKKLIEVALPLEAINRESAREKSIRHGHPSTLHLWWARRPLAACRAVLFASIVDDPSSRPEEFATDEDQERERQRLFRIIEELVKWDNSNNESVLEAARAEIRKATDGNPPPVLDPFCGGGSIPLEAQRLGLEAHASDLNPVAVLITKALVEIPPKFAGRPPVNPESREKLAYGATWKGAQGLAEDVRYYGKWMRDEAFKSVSHLYPKATLPGGGEATVIAWLWARTVKCPNPACGAQMPLVRSFALSTKRGKEKHVEPIVDRDARMVRFEVRSGPTAHEGTVGRRGARCVVCGTPAPLTHVRAEGQAGRMSAQLMAMVVEGDRQRVYLSPDPNHAAIAHSAVPSWRPSGSTPERLTGGTCYGYGFTEWGDLFTPRQLVVLTILSERVAEASKRIHADSADHVYSDAVATYIGLGVSKSADYNSSLVLWSPSRDQAKSTFARQALPMVWDFAEVNPFAGAAGDLEVSVSGIAETLERLPTGQPGWTKQLDATAAADGVIDPLVCTDPPYYDNIGYADVSDFFYVWLRRSLKNLYPDLFSTLLTPKEQELVATPYRFGGDRRRAEQFFERGLGQAFEHLRRAQHTDYPLTLFYAFRQAESEATEDGAVVLTSTGWETMLRGLLSAGLAVTGTWPMRTERGGRTVGIGTNALASSIVLVCRPQSADVGLTTRRVFLAALRAELPEALRMLQHGNIAPVDLAQAAIGPGMAIFSRYAKVVEADGSAMTVRTALGLVNQALDEILAEQEGDFDGDTRFAVTWFEQHGISEGPYGEADVLARAKNTSVAGMEAAGVLHSRAGKVRLLNGEELSDSWDPVADRRITVWEVTQHLIKRLEEGGEEAAAELLRRVGGLGEAGRELAYRLYTTCERKGWAQEALSYNALVVAWPEIARRVAGTPEAEAQQALEV
jgi:putative DNA methylase